MPLPLMAGRYQLEELLGRGGMGVVYRATDQRTGGAVAVKVLNPALAHNPDYLERLRREARITASITSPRVVRVIDLDEHDGTPFIVLEYVHGPTLDQLLAEEGPFTAREAVTICLELARALEAAHELGVIHRDLKPENIKLADGQVKVLDFGLARSEGDRGVTITGSYIGTPHYSAPERIAGRGDIRADIYAVGAILFTLLAGSPPFDGPTSVAILMQHASAPLPELPTESAPLQALISCCMAKSPADRYQTPAALMAALGVVLRTLPHATDVERRPLRVLPASERITPWLRHVDQSPSVAAALPDEGSGEHHAATVTTRLTTTPATSNDSSARKTQHRTATASRRRFLAGLAGAGAGVVLVAAAVAVVLVNRGGEEAPSTPSSSNIIYHPRAQSAGVTTLAGTSSAGLRDGPGDKAEFPRPVDVAVDGAGMVYVVDASWIRRISPAGAVTTLAGSAETGFVDGSIATARFDNPRGVAVDGAGTLYIADSNNHRIRTISPDGLVRTFAGAGTPGFADGPGDRAQFNLPADIAVDAAGTVYVADALNNRIRRIGRDGVVSTLAGEGAGSDRDAPGTPALFSFPNGVAVDASGTVYVADTYNARIRAISPSGEVHTVAGSGDSGDADGPAGEAGFIDPFAVAVDRSGNLYVLDKSSRVRVISSGGTVTTLAGSADTGAENGAGNDAQFDQPLGIAVGADGKVYIADTENHRIRLLRWSP